MWYNIFHLFIAYQGKVHSVGLIINPLFLFFPCLFIQWLHYIQILVFFSSLIQIKLFGDASHIFITLLGRRCIDSILVKKDMMFCGHVDDSYPSSVWEGG